MYFGSKPPSSAKMYHDKCIFKPFFKLFTLNFRELHLIVGSAALTALSVATGDDEMVDDFFVVVPLWELIFKCYLTKQISIT